MLKSTLRWWYFLLVHSWLKDRIPAFIAYRCVPRRLAYWCFVRVATSNGQGGAYEFNPGDRTCVDALKGWKL